MKDIIYDEFGQRTKLSLGNGVVNEYTYDQNTRRLSHLKSFKGSNVFQNISYKFDAVGNILERVNKDFVTSGSVKKTSKQTYEYDNLYRLTSSEGEYTKESWLPYFNDRTNIYTSSTSYNNVGNITHKMVDNKGIYPELGNDMRVLKDTTYDRAYTYGGAQPHAVTKAGDLVMGYDANGNMVSKEWTKYGVKMSMTWNSENRMTESVSQNIYSGAKTLTRYKYDHEGNRVVKSSNYGEVVTPSAEISYRNDSIVTKHIFVSGVRVASKVCDDKSSNTYYQSVDHLGSTNVLTDDKGEFYEHIETFPDGSIWVKEYVDQSGVNAVFTCHEMDVETKFFYATSRYYDASLSVFISTDDRFDGLFTHKGLNVYSYCHHNPVKFVDPDGHAIYGSDSGYGSSGGYYGSTQSGTGNVSETNTTNQPYMQSDYGANSQFYGNVPDHYSSECLSIPWMDTAESQLGVLENTSTQVHNPTIIAYHATTSLRAQTDEVAWCSSFVNWCFANNEITGTNSAASQSWRSWGQTINRPAVGSIGIMSHGNGFGHVGFVAGQTQDGNIVLLGGNQRNSVRYSYYFEERFVQYVYPEHFMPNYDLPILDMNNINNGGSYAETR